jgi:hypothetical protein
LERGAGAIQAEGQGVWRLRLIEPSRALELCELTRKGDRQSRVLHRYLSKAIKDVQELRPPMMCSLCDREFSGGQVPAAFVILTAAIDMPSKAMTDGLCIGCATAGDVAHRVVSTFAGWGKVRVVPDFSGVVGQA